MENITYPHHFTTQGGAARGKYSPKVVQCYNRGFDGLSVQWECKAEMSVRYKFGRVEVSCEGFDRPGDPYVLPGSCGVSQYIIQQIDPIFSCATSWITLTWISRHTVPVP